MRLALLTLVDESATAVCRADPRFEIQACQTLAGLWSAARRESGCVALLDYRRIDGLLSEEHRHDLTLLGRLVPLVLLVDCTFGADMRGADLGVVAVVHKPAEALNLLGGTYGLD